MKWCCSTGKLRSLKPVLYWRSSSSLRMLQLSSVMRMRKRIVRGGTEQMWNPGRWENSQTNWNRTSTYSIYMLYFVFFTQILRKKPSSSLSPASMDTSEDPDTEEALKGFDFLSSTDEMDTSPESRGNGDGTDWGESQAVHGWNHVMYTVCESLMMAISVQNCCVKLIKVILEESPFGNSWCFVMFWWLFIIHVSCCSHKSFLECFCLSHSLWSYPLCVTIATCDHNVPSTPVFELHWSSE